MVQIQLHGTAESVTMDAMFDSGAKEAFIDSEVSDKHGITMKKQKPRANLPRAWKTKP